MGATYVENTILSVTSSPDFFCLSHAVTPSSRFGGNDDHRTGTIVADVATATPTEMASSSHDL
jgi:hypothetical protein